LRKTIFIGCGIGDNPVAKQFDALSSELISRGYQIVRLIDGQKKELEKKGNPSIFTWPSLRPTKLKDAIFLIKLIKKFKPCVIIANFGSVNLMMILGFLFSIPLRVTWYHTTSSQNRFDFRGSRSWLNFQINRKKLVYLFASKIIANSKATKKDLIEKYKIDEGKVIVFYNLLEKPITTQNINQNSDLKMIVCPGRLDYSKGQDVLLKAIKEMKRVNVEYVFIGDGNQREELMKLAKELHIEKSCLFLGRLPHSSVIANMVRAYCVIVPSRDEAFGYVNIEAMSVGVPVIASDVGGIPEIIRDGIDGFLVPPSDPKILAEKISYLLDNPSLRDEMGENARQRFLDKFELNKNIEKMADWFDSEINKRI